MTAEVQCRSCGAPSLSPILSLGRTPLANALLTEAQLGEPEELFPLDLAFCTACSLVQITETVPPEKLFREYVYFSSFSEGALRNAEAVVTRTIAQRSLGGHSLAAEIASNDGYLLQYYKARGVPVLGIEPARNIAKVANDKGITTLCEFFGKDLAMTLAREGRRADVIHANNVLAHVADLNGFVAGIAAFLAPTGVAIIEVPYLKDLLDKLEFDTIYHEHLCYFSLTALERIFSRHGLIVSDVEWLPIHGGSLRVSVSLQGHATPSDAVREYLARERGWGVDDPATYESFGRRVDELKGKLVRLLDELRRDGKSIVAYGASAKGSTLLNYFGIGRERLAYVVDRSTVKQGLYTPGTHLPIHAPERLAEQPDYVLLLTWNFADEIMAQQDAYRRAGGRFIIPLPEPRVV
ncbi:MAG TPA: class I SAM-dependent methyltransferase [Kofleriaceae bacterium]|nr:class I SAM-dependent methyltransferase [Kofleriaceae bacterium]